MSGGTVTSTGWNMGELGEVIDLEEARKLPSLQAGDVLDAEIDRISNAGNHVVEYGKSHILLTDTISNNGSIGNPGDSVRIVIEESNNRAQTIYVYDTQSPYYKSNIEEKIELMKKLTEGAKKRINKNRKRKNNQRRNLRQQKSNNNIYKGKNMNYLLNGKL